MGRGEEGRGGVGRVNGYGISIETMLLELTYKIA